MADQAAGCLLLGLFFVGAAIFGALDDALGPVPQGLRVGRKVTSLGLGREVGVRLEDRCKHAHIIGPTGSGKSTLDLNLIQRDLADGAGVGVIDPKGDLIQDVMENLPSWRFDDVILFDPTDTAYPVGFNILEEVEPRYRSRTASEVVGVFKKLWDDSWGPRLEHILRYTVLTLLELEEATLLDIPLLLNSDTFRQQTLAHVTNLAVQDFWQQEFAAMTPRFRSEAISPILNKVGPWLAYDECKLIVGQARSSFQLRDVLDRGKILLCYLPQGLLGEDTSSLLGALIVSKIQLAAMTRAGLPAERKREFYLYIDEAHNFVTSALEKTLVEARSFGLGLICSNQYPAQLSEELALALTNNVAVRISCYLEGDDYRARYQLLQDRGVEDIIIKPDPPPRDGYEALPKLIRHYCRQRYGRPRQEVENDILARRNRRLGIDTNAEPTEGEQIYEETAQDEWIET